MKLHVTAEALVDNPEVDQGEMEEIRQAVKEDVEDCLRYTGLGSAVSVDVRVEW